MKKNQDCLLLYRGISFLTLVNTEQVELKQTDANSNRTENQFTMSKVRATRNKCYSHSSHNMSQYV